MEFDREFMQESIYDSAATVLDEIVGTSRWSIKHRRVFRHEDKFYETLYSVGATECQDESPYQYDAATIECAEVWPVERTITVYEKREP